MSRSLIEESEGPEPLPELSLPTLQRETNTVLPRHRRRSRSQQAGLLYLPPVTRSDASHGWAQVEADVGEAGGGDRDTPR
jgi:hypothetical protein